MLAQPQGHRGCGAGSGAERTAPQVGEWIFFYIGRTLAVQGHGYATRYVFDRCILTRIGHRRIVDGLHDESHRGETGDGAIEGLIFEAVRAVVVRIRRISERPVTVQRQRAVGRTAIQSCGQRIFVWIAVVGQHAGRCYLQHFVLEHAVAVVLGHRRIVDGLHDESHRGETGDGAIEGLIFEAVRAVVVRIRRISERPVTVQRQRAVGRTAIQSCGQRIILRVSVVGQHAGRLHRQHLVLVGGVAVVGSHRRFVDLVHGDVNLGDIAFLGAIADLVFEAVVAVPVLIRRVGERPVAIQLQRAVERPPRV